MATFKLGFVGAGFIARFQAQALLQVRNADIAGVVWPTQATTTAFSQYVQEHNLGQGKI